jgi:hypothetical protein
VFIYQFLVTVEEEEYSMVKRTLSISSLMTFLLAVVVGVHAELVAHWPMDEGGGDEIDDIIGKGGVGTFVGAPNWVDGVFGSAVECSQGNYIRIPGNPDIEPPSVTATMWVYFNDVGPPRQDFFSKNDDYALSLHEWDEAPGTPGHGTIFPIIRSPANVWTVIKGTVVVEAGRWYHVALVYDAGTEDLLTYIDGVEDARTVAPGGIGQSGGPLTLGDYSGRVLRGILDEVKIWNEALSQSEIQADMGMATTAVSSHGKLSALWGQIKLTE